MQHLWYHQINQQRRQGPYTRVPPDTAAWTRRCSVRGDRSEASSQNPSRQALMSVLLANICSLDNKMDYIRLQLTSQSNLWPAHMCRGVLRLLCLNTKRSELKMSLFWNPLALTRNRGWQLRSVPCWENVTLHSDLGGWVDLRTARAQLSHAIRRAKCQYAKKILNYFCDTRDTRHMRQGIQTWRDYKNRGQWHPPPWHM